MLYAALTFWLLIIVFSAWGVHSMWSALVKPRIVNSVLLPGTLVATLGHVLGLLITGNPVRNTTLMGEDESGDPQADAPEKQGIPIIGSVLVGFLPLLACTVALYFAMEHLGKPALTAAAQPVLPRELPQSLGAFWDLLHASLTAAQTLLDSVLEADLRSWPTLAFLYLSICLTVRMTPFEGTQRGAIMAIVLTGVVIALAASVSKQVESFVISAWPLLSFAVATLLILLLFSLLVTGAVTLGKVLAKQD